jgi:hypothetical protein
MYKIKNEDSFAKGFIVRVSDNAFIPMSEANTDYKQYLKWVAEGNEAEEGLIR